MQRFIDISINVSQRGKCSKLVQCVINYHGVSGTQVLYGKRSFLQNKLILNLFINGFNQGTTLLLVCLAIADPVAVS